MQFPHFVITMISDDYENVMTRGVRDGGDGYTEWLIDDSATTNVSRYNDLATCEEIIDILLNQEVESGNSRFMIEVRRVDSYSHESVVSYRVHGDV